jgi:hypothetical protein
MDRISSDIASEQSYKDENNGRNEEILNGNGGKINLEMRSCSSLIFK